MKQRYRFPIFLALFGLGVIAGWYLHKPHACKPYAISSAIAQSVNGKIITKQSSLELGCK